MIDKLRKQILSNCSRDLITNGDDDEVHLGLSEYQIGHAQKQGRHAIKALECVSNAHSNGTNVTWREACESASDILLSDACGRTIERWFLTCKDSHETFPPNERGIHTITKDLNPFVRCKDENDNDVNKVDNNDIYKKLKSGLYYT